MKKFVRQLKFIPSMTLATGLVILASGVSAWFTHGSAWSLIFNFAALILLFFFYRTLNSKIRAFLLASKNSIEPQLTHEAHPKTDVLVEMDQLGKSLREVGKRMNYMIDQMADKVLIDQEVQSAELFQSLFLPKDRFESENFVLDGRYLPANQCSGDWWQFFRAGDELLVLIGDVTGHGVAAALVTAAVQAAYSVVVRQVRTTHGNTAIPSLNVIFSYLNEAVLAVGGTEASMTLFGSVINLKTGLLTTLNASHRPAYVFRKSSPESAPSGEEQYSLHKTLIEGQTGSLGESCDYTVPAQRFQLKPGDFVFWYTDGFLECTNSAGETISKKKILQFLQKEMNGQSGKASHLSDSALQEFFKFVGGRGTIRQDDVIVIFGAVPEMISFVEGEILPVEQVLTHVS